MAAILRVKRRYEDEPALALLIACKRLKTAEDAEAEVPANSDPVKTVVKFAGTVKNQEDDVVQHIVRTLGKDELKSSFKQPPVDVLNKIREKKKQTSAENRFKVVNALRSLDTSNSELFEDKPMTLIDVEDSQSCAVKDSTEKDAAYEYDLYYAQTEEDMHIDDMVSIHALDQEFVFDMYRNNDNSENECESEDSNSESNWRNDYPDSDHSDGSIDEDDMRNAVMQMRLEDDSESSSDDDFVYAVNEKDVEEYGYKYARYKARIKEELDEENSNASDLFPSDDPDEEDTDHSDTDKQ